MNTLETIKNKIEEINRKKEELIPELRKDFFPMIKPLFEKSNGKIKSIGWTQYTPYFNDGDECTFSTNFEYCIEINGENEDEIESLDWRIKYYIDGDPEYKLEPNWDLVLYGLVEEFKETLQAIDDEFYKDLFGDHVLVTIFDDGRIETEEYEHD